MAAPYFAKMFPRISKLEERRAFFKTVLDEYQTDIEEHRRTLDPNEPRDYVDMFLIEEMKVLFKG